MAGTTVACRVNSPRESAERQALIQLNQVIDDMEVMRAGLAALAAKFNSTLTKLDADAGVTDTTYSSLGAVTTTTYDAAGDLLAAKVGGASGTPVTT